jgi:hypothetical protein
VVTDANSVACRRGVAVFGSVAMTRRGMHGARGKLAGHTLSAGNRRLAMFGKILRALGGTAPDRVSTKTRTSYQWRC